MPPRPELPSGPNSGREGAFHQPGRGLTPFISYFPQLKIGSKLLWSRERGEKGGRRQSPPWPTGHPHLGPATLAHCGWVGSWGGVGAGPRLPARVSFGLRAGLGDGARARHSPANCPLRRVEGPHLGAALTSGQRPELQLPADGRSGHTWAQAMSSQWRLCSGSQWVRGCPLSLHPPQSLTLTTSLMLGPRLAECGPWGHRPLSHSALLTPSRPPGNP